jgi:hypothetical protein
LAGIFFHGAGSFQAAKDARVPVLHDATDGHIAGPPKVVDCVADEEALRHARNLVDGHAIEVWDGARFIVRIESKTS